MKTIFRLFLALHVCFTCIIGVRAETPCGSILFGELEGTISYKADELYSPNERCVWTIRIPDATEITFQLIQSGIPWQDAGDGISIMANADTVFLQHPGPNVTLDGFGFAFVTFLTDTTLEGQGFILSYKATGFHEDWFAKESVHFISTTPTGFLPHHPSGNYFPSEMSTFIIAPPGFVADSDTLINVVWNRRGLGTNLLAVFKFRPITPMPEWTLSDILSSTSPSPLTISHNDSILFLFGPDDSPVGKGFTLMW